MHKKVIITLIASLFSVTSYAENGWRFFAGMEDDFKHETTTSVLLGGLGPNSSVGDTGLSYGLEISFNCPLLQPPSNKIRQQVSALRYKDGDSTIQTIQINPHYVVEVIPNLWMGGGPGIGYVRARVNKITSNMVAGQLGASLHYNIEKIFIGAEARYQITQRDDVGGIIDEGADNWQAILKLGYNLY